MNLEQIIQQHTVYNNNKNALSSNGVTSNADTSDELKDKVDDLILQYQSNQNTNKVTQELEDDSNIQIEQDAMKLEVNVDDLKAQKNIFLKAISSFKYYYDDVLYRGILGGSREAGQQLIQATTEFTEAGLEELGKELGYEMDKSKWNTLSDEQKNKYREIFRVYDQEKGDKIYFGKNVDLEVPYNLPSVEEPKTILGSFVRDASQFLTSFVLAPGGKTAVGKYVTKGAIADALFDPKEGNLATFIKEFAYVDDNGDEQIGIVKEVLDFLDSKVDDSAEAEDKIRARLKQSVEGGILGLAVDGFMVGLKYAKGNEDLKTIIIRGITEQEYDPKAIKEATKIVRTGKAKTAAKQALKYREIRSTLIKQFEQTIGARSQFDIDEVIDDSLLISKKDKKGFLVLDMDKAKKSGLNIAKYRNADELNMDVLDYRQSLGRGERGDETASLIRDAENNLVFPILKPEKLDALVAAAGDVFEKFPNKVDLKNKSVIDNLMELSLETASDGKPLLATDELLETLNKYGISFEEYVTMSVGSASSAGKVLQKMSAIAKRFKSKEVLGERDSINKTQKNIAKVGLRIENISRGLLVSQIATAMRNVQSAGIRAPLEALQNVMDTALYNLENEGIVSGMKAIISPTNWTDSFKGMRYMYDASNWGEFAELTDFILKTPGFGDEHKRMFDQVSEVRRNMELDLKGSGLKTKAMEKVLKGAEGGVDFLNSVNRWQEYMIRRATFMGELERLVKRKYNIDLMELAKTGNIDDLLSKEDFKEVLTDSVTKAMDITYAKQPDFYFFKETTNFITRNGLTTVAPFPRFMFNSMELLGNYAAGAPLPIMKKVLGGGKFTAKDRKQISRNMLGWTVVLPAAMMYRNQDDAPADYKLLANNDGTTTDTTPMSPLLRQSLWIAEAIKRNDDGELLQWMEKQGWREATETIFGTNLRVGSGEVIFKDLAEAVLSSDGMGTEKGAKFLGTFMGEWISRFGTPLNQIIEVQRGMGYRTDEFKDFNTEPEIKSSGNIINFAQEVGKYVMQPSKKRGYLNIFSPGTDEEFIDVDGNVVKVPNRETVFQAGNRNYRVGSMLKVFSGLSTKREYSDAGKYLEDLGYRDFKIVTRSISPGFKNFEAASLRENLTTIVDHVKEGSYFYTMQEKFYNKLSDKAKSNIKKRTFIRDAQRKEIDNQLRFFKSKIDKFIAGIETDDKGSLKFDIEFEKSRYVLAAQKFRRLPATAKKDALNKMEIFLKGETLDLSNPIHLEKIVDFAKTK